MNTSDVSVTLRDMWQTRPIRPRDDRKIAGVGAAVARRYDLDPVLVRVGLVAAAVAGVGVAFYIAAWAVLPGERSDGAAPPRRRLWTLVVLGVVAAASIGHVANDPSGFLLSAAAVTALLFLLHRSRAGRGTPGTGSTRGVAPAAGAGGPEGVTPPAWDPLGAAPFAWDLPEPGPPPVAPARPRSRVTPVTLAAALLAGGVTALVLLTVGGLTDLPVLLGVVLAVLGTGLVVGAFTRSGRGLIPFALVGALLTWGALAAPLDRIAQGQAGDISATPLTPAALAPRYESSMGTVELDLRRMDLTVPPGATVTPVQTRVDSGMGTVEIQVPRDADVRFTAETGLGSITFDDRSSDGPHARLAVDDLGADGVASGRPLVLDVQAGMGAVEVHRG